MNIFSECRDLAVRLLRDVTPRQAIVVALLVAVLAAMVFRRPKGEDPAVAAKAFFAKVAEGRVAEAFADATVFFQTEEPLAAFDAAVRDLRIVSGRGVTTEPAAVKGRTAKLRVECTLANSARQPFFVTMLRESGKWRVFTVKASPDEKTPHEENLFTIIGTANTLTGAVDKPMPDDATIRAMTLETLLQFHDAIRQRSFEEFYENASRNWQAQLTLGMLTRTFQGFLDQQPDLIGIKQVSPVFEEAPRIDPDGLLVVSGSYPTKPLRVRFALKYFHDMPAWRIFGLTVSLNK